MAVSVVVMVIYGQPAVVTSPAVKLAGLRCITEHMAPGQWDYARQPSRKELAATRQQPIPDPALLPGIPVPAHIRSRAGQPATRAMTSTPTPPHQSWPSSSPANSM